MTTTAPDHSPSPGHAPAPDHRPLRRPRHASGPPPLRSEFRRGLAPWAGATVAVTLTVLMAAKSGQWQGNWGETQSLLKTAATLIGGPLAVAAGCWQGGRERRRRTVELLSTASRGRCARTLVAVAPLVAWVLIGYAVALAASLLATLPYTHRGRPLVPYALTDLTFLASITVVGFVAGRVIPWRLTAPLLAACAYLGLGFPSYVSSDLRLLSPNEQVDTTHVPLWWQPLVMSAWTCGLAATLLVLYAARRRVLAVVPLVVAVAAGTTVAQVGTGMWRHVPTPGVRVCDYDTLPGICVDDPDRDLLPAIRAALAGLNSRVAELPDPPVSYVSTDTGPGPAEARLPLLTRGWTVARNELVDPAGFARETAARLPLFGSCPAEKFTEAESAHFWETRNAVLAWLAPPSPDAPPTGASGTDAPAPARQTELRAPLAAMTPAARKAWLDRYAAATRACDPKRLPKL
ncbi:hypothetical protein ACIO3O_11585 [Streptomyces sp. NPDC087440]|uniref:hypothetical protein n=1 Tax=Streptomyces sp. NPDC087440 TaxID=3365790 RepID=UPI00382D0AE8